MTHCEVQNEDYLDTSIKGQTFASVAKDEINLMLNLLDK